MTPVGPHCCFPIFQFSIFNFQFPSPTHPFGQFPTPPPACSPTTRKRFVSTALAAENTTIEWME
jgi:hypothetical protein